MNTNPKLRLLVARVLIATTTSACLPPHAHAGLISTEAAIPGNRDRILVLLDRADISAQLEARGVSPSDAKARIAALSDAEVAQLSAAIDNAPAGARGELLFYGVLLLLLPLIAIALVAKGVLHVGKAIAEGRTSDAPAIAP